MFTVGMRVCCGGGNVGCEPLPAETGSVATSPQALSANTTMPINGAIKRRDVSLVIDIERLITTVPLISRIVKVSGWQEDYPWCAASRPDSQRHRAWLS
jgi:hypothetical protein